MSEPRRPPNSADLAGAFIFINLKINTNIFLKSKINCHILHFSCIDGIDNFLVHYFSGQKWIHKKVRDLSIFLKFI